ncbi:hypothetical protein [Mycolicibacterium mageritense]|uniref:Uncharacterized protein n=1 Tax=Mycolicibacterium mageritense TaxID=53462 RepID=A0AAI8U2V6_MYCME|nr:hypothetical protein [Mycolicibacterium mageritense]BDY33172.1 hypothetical protein hbim_07147 [Mycolicibacterium mageritense]
MGVISIEQFQKSDRLEVLAQTKLTKKESEELNDLVKFFQENGAEKATRSGVVRALITDGLAAFKEEMGKD